MTLFEKWAIGRFGIREYCDVYGTLCKDSVSRSAEPCHVCYEKWKVRQDHYARR